jgi:hypothetical protein
MANVFLSAKSNDNQYALELYRFLSAKGIPTFFAPESLPQLASADYRHAIDSELDQCRHLVVVTSSGENAASRWVEAEWGFYVGESRAGRKNGNLVTLVVGRVNVSDLPPALRQHQVVRYSREAFDTILNYVRPTNRDDRNREAESPTSATRSAAESTRDAPIGALDGTIDLNRLLFDEVVRGVSSLPRNEGIVVCGSSRAWLMDPTPPFDIRTEIEFGAREASACTVTPDGDVLVVGNCSPPSISLYSLQSRKEVLHFNRKFGDDLTGNGPAGVDCFEYGELRMSSRGKYFAAMVRLSDHHMSVLNHSTEYPECPVDVFDLKGDLVFTNEEYHNGMDQVGVFSADDLSIAIADRDFTNGDFNVYDIAAKGETVWSFFDHGVFEDKGLTIDDLLAHPNGHDVIVSGSKAGRFAVTALSLRTGRTMKPVCYERLPSVATLEYESTSRLLKSPDGRSLFAVHNKGFLKEWRLPRFDSQRTLRLTFPETLTTEAIGGVKQVEAANNGEFLFIVPGDSDNMFWMRLARSAIGDGGVVGVPSLKPTAVTGKRSKIGTKKRVRGTSGTRPQIDS